MLLSCPVYEYANHSVLWYISKMHCLLTKAPTLHVVCCTVWLWCVCTNSHRDQTETSPFPVRLQINEAFKWRSESSSASLGHTVSLLQVHDVCVLNPCGSMLLLHEIQLSLMHEQTAALWKYTGSIRLSPVSFHLHAGAISAAVWSIKVPVQIVYRLKHLPCLQLNRSDNVCFALSHSHV